MCGHVHLAFDAQLPHVQRFLYWVRLGLQPMRCPANEIRCEQDERLLKRDGRFGTHFEVVQGEHLLALFHPGFNFVTLHRKPRTGAMQMPGCYNAKASYLAGFCNANPKITSTT
jgi:hypothetical protein